MAGLRGQNAPVLIIGVHKAELPFGREVAKIVLRSKLIPNLKVIEIEEGLDQPHTFRDRKFFYNAFHKEIYLQIYQQVKNRHDLILDLHAGHIQEGRAAEIYSGSRRLLYQIEELKKNEKGPVSKYPIDLFLITDRDEDTKKMPDVAICHTIIPKQLWRSDSQIYVGIEIYMEQQEKFKDADILFAAQVINMTWTGFKMIKKVKPKLCTAKEGKNEFSFYIS